jgi:AhpD family alkylhydroperoxidase
MVFTSQSMLQHNILWKILLILRSAGMSNSREATVRLVDEDGAGGKVREIFDDIKATKGIDFVPNLWRTLAVNPAQLELVWTQLKALMHPDAAGRKSRLDARTREIIALAVSATNGCAYCVNSHTAALKKQGVDTETLAEVLAIVGLFNQTNALADGYQIEPDVLPPLE